LRLTSLGRVHFCWSVGDVGMRVCLPALGAEGSTLAGGSPYSSRPAPNISDTFLVSKASPSDEHFFERTVLQRFFFFYKTLFFNISFSKLNYNTIMVCNKRCSKDVGNIEE
jgi:hypothetical protein